MSKELPREFQRMLQFEKIKDFLNFDDIGKFDKTDLYYVEKEHILEVELVANLLKKVNVKRNSQLGKEIINLMIFYRKAYSFLRVCSTAITYGSVGSEDEEFLKEHYDFLVKSGLENILKSYFKKTSYEKLMRVVNHTYL